MRGVTFCAVDETEGRWDTVDVQRLVNFAEELEEGLEMIVAVIDVIHTTHLANAVH